MHDPKAYTQNTAGDFKSLAEQLCNLECRPAFSYKVYVKSLGQHLGIRILASAGGSEKQLLAHLLACFLNQFSQHPRPDKPYDADCGVCAGNLLVDRGILSA